MMLSLRKANTKFVAERVENGQLVFSRKFDRYSVKDQKQIAAAFEWTIPQLLAAISSVTDVSFYPLPAKPEPEQFRVWVRDISSERGHPIVCQPHEVPINGDKLLDWDDRQELCCLDVDYHSAVAPPQAWVEQRMMTFAPRPFAWKFSRSGGVHMFFCRSGSLTAEELAAVGLLAWLRLDRRATCDLVTKIRQGEVNTQTPNTDLGPLANVIGRGDADPIEFMQERGWSYGMSLKHSECPIEPNDTAHGDPVFIGDAGVFCHRCAAKGVSLGSRRPGFVPWVSLMGGGVDPILVTMARHRCHWTHARAVVSDKLRIPEEVAKLCYGVLVKLFHDADDPRLPAVMRVGADLIRLDGRWTTADGVTPWQGNFVPTLRSLPATQYVAEGIKVDETIVDAFRQPHNLTQYGYPSLSVVRGCRIYGQHMSYVDDNRVVIVTPSAVVAQNPQCAPRYRKERMPREGYWRVIERVFPGVNREYLKLLIAAKGCTEERIGLPPMLLVDGPSGSAKSATVMLAAAIVGDTVADVVFSADVQRFRQAIQSAAEQGSYIAVNEVLKEGARAKLSAAATLDPLLNLTEDSMSHKMYVGPVRLGTLPVTVLTDVHTPEEVRTDVQLARRLVHVRQTDRLDWEASLLASDVRDIRRFRVHSLEYAAACDSLLSDVIDDFFATPMTFAQIAKELGFSTLERSSEYDDPSDNLRTFYRLVCEAPEVRDSAFSGRGWKAIDRNQDTPLVNLWLALCDGGSSFTESRKCRERDWRQTLGSEEPVSIDIAPRRPNLVYVRFRTGTRKNPEKVNQECV